LKREDLYSVKPIPRRILGPEEYVNSVAKGHFDPGFTIEGELFSQRTALSFELGGLKNPVAAIVFYDARSEDCWGLQFHCATITEDTYRPQIAIKNDVWFSVLPKLQECLLLRLMDPSIALTALYTTSHNSLQTPTLLVPGKTRQPISLPTPISSSVNWKDQKPGHSHDQSGGRETTAGVETGGTYKPTQDVASGILDTWIYKIFGKKSDRTLDLDEGDTKKAGVNGKNDNRHKTQDPGSPSGQLEVFKGSAARAKINTRLVFVASTLTVACTVGSSFLLMRP
jgi:hypothetical protein